MAKSTEPTSQRDRSPSYPAIPLEQAVERLVQFESHFKRSAARLEKANVAWGINQAGHILAALKSFGFLEYQGPTESREVVISEEGRTYLRAQQDSIKREVLQRAALRPAFIATMWKEWGHDRPNDAACIDTLVFKHKFSERGAPIFLKVYDSTIAYAGLGDSDKISAEEVDAEVTEQEVPEVSRSAPAASPSSLSMGGKVKIMDTERIVFTEEGQPNQYLKVIASGEVDDSLLEALEDFVKRQRKRLGRPPAADIGKPN